MLVKQMGGPDRGGPRIPGGGSGVPNPADRRTPRLGCLRPENLLLYRRTRYFSINDRTCMITKLGKIHGSIKQAKQLKILFELVISNLTLSILK